jgi:hypothetical protein
MKVPLGIITIFPIGKKKGHGSLDYTSYNTIVIRLYEKTYIFFSTMSSI